MRFFFVKATSKLFIMKMKKIFYLFLLFQFVFIEGYSQSKTAFEGNRWRLGLGVQYSSSFQNLQVVFPSGYTAVLGGFTGQGVNLFGGYKFHKYIVGEMEAGVIINSNSQSNNNGDVEIGRFNKFYLHPKVKFVYPIVKGDRKTISLFGGGGVGFNASGRLYMEQNYAGYKAVKYARYEPMMAPFAVIGSELLFGGDFNMVVGFKYQNGSFNAMKYSDSYDPYANITNAPLAVKTLDAQGLALFFGILQEF